jgi:hypothetical protein
MAVELGFDHEAAIKRVDNSIKQMNPISCGKTSLKISN